MGESYLPGTIILQLAGNNSICVLKEREIECDFSYGRWFVRQTCGECYGRRYMVG